MLERPLWGALWVRSGSVLSRSTVATPSSATHGSVAGHEQTAVVAAEIVVNLNVWITRRLC